MDGIFLVIVSPTTEVQEVSLLPYEFVTVSTPSPHRIFPEESQSRDSDELEPVVEPVEEYHHCKKITHNGIHFG